MPVCLADFGGAGFEGSGRLSRKVCVPEAIGEAPEIQGPKVELSVKTLKKLKRLLRSVSGNRMSRDLG